MATLNIQRAIGQRVKVATHQPNRLGGPKYPGRTGAITDRNKVGGDDHGGLWVVALDATTRAKARTETFWGEVLELLEPGAPEKG